MTKPQFLSLIVTFSYLTACSEVRDTPAYADLTYDPDSQKLDD